MKDLMQVQILKSKIHRAEVTSGSLHYQGSLGIDEELMELVGMLPYEKILVGNITNGHRFETYAIPAERGKREIILNGAVCHLGKTGDRLVIMSFAQMTPDEAAAWQPKVIVLDEKNSVIHTK